MRFSINLATQRYEDAGRFYRRWLLALAVVTVFSVVLIYSAMSAWRASYDSSRRIRQEKHLLAQLEADRKTDEAILNDRENRDVRERSEFLNDLIRRKAFSWTLVFTDLERIMPPRLHVVSIKPDMTPDNQLSISMTVAGDSRDRALELVRRMEESKSFVYPAVQSESTTTQPPDTVEFEITAGYRPAALPAATPSTPAQTQAKLQAGGR